MSSRMPDRPISRKSRLARAAVITGVVVRHLVRALPVLLARSVRRGRHRAELVDVLRPLVVELGPSFIKGAQLLSTRPDLLPRNVCVALGKLHDRVPPMTAAQTRAALDIAYRGRPWPFSEFREEPVASGSIACVYRARLHDGSEVAVKVRRQGLDRLVRADFALATSGAALVQRLPGMGTLPARTIMEQCRDAVLAQLDFSAEADMLDLLRTNLADLDFLRIPAPVRDACADGVLVMEYVPGLRRFGQDELRPEVAELVVKRALRCVYRMLFMDGVVHCDMHPGNLYLDDSGGIVLLDAGFTVTLEPHVRRLFAEFFLNMARGNGEYCADVVERSAEGNTDGADLVRFRAGIVELVTSAHSKSAGEFKLAPFAATLFDLQRRCGLYAAPEFVFPLLSLLVLEGMINDFHAGVDFQAEAKPVLLRSLLTGIPKREVHA